LRNQLNWTFGVARRLAYKKRTAIRDPDHSCFHGIRPCFVPPKQLQINCEKSIWSRTRTAGFVKFLWIFLDRPNFSPTVARPSPFARRSKTVDEQRAKYKGFHHAGNLETCMSHPQAVEREVQEQIRSRTRLILIRLRLGSCGFLGLRILLIASSYPPYLASGKT
jgi:hypothetical protein